jgi:hypothetical protein
MKKLLIMIGVTVFGTIGWWLGDFIGTMTAYLLSAAGSMFGVYVAWRIHRDYF